MIKNIYYIIIALFILGGILISNINSKKSNRAKKENWLKFFSYFVITNLIIISIMFYNMCFYYITIAISIFGLFEISKAIFYSRNFFTGVVSILFFLPLAYVFIRFAQLKQNILLYTYLVVIIFDAFSQLTGQLFGKTRIVPSISPNKTLEGFAGGIISTSLISVFFSGLIDVSVIKAIVLSIAISIFAFLGDLLASFCKRNFDIKDFSKILPGQGGVLDRFDSLIFSSLIITILNYYNFI